MLSRPFLTGTLVLGAVFAAPFAHAQDKGFVPDTGQINQGAAHLPPAPMPPIPRADHEDVRAALLMPNTGTISLGEDQNAGGKPQPETTGKGITSGEQTGPIGSQLQTKPAKFSHRNDAIDHTPIMGMAFKLDAQQRQQIFQAVMSDKTEGAADATDLNPADALPYSLVGSIHPLPESLRSMPTLARLDYMKGKDKIYLVSTATAVPIVVDVLDGK